MTIFVTGGAGYIGSHTCVELLKNWKTFLDVTKKNSTTRNHKIPYNIMLCYVDSISAHSLIRWSAEHNLDQMCRDAWNFQFQNPQGYQ